MRVVADGISVSGCRVRGVLHFEFFCVGQRFIWRSAIWDAVRSSFLVVWHFRTSLLRRQLLWVPQEGT